ncbi:MAG: AraC family transcriptional regulator [Flavobacteriaceae bacterium]|jgi:AraC-like DNA-binding protein|nr:AraC family transcriptional regulator [Flavobacteriaceae bacterium]
MRIDTIKEGIIWSRDYNNLTNLSPQKLDYYIVVLCLKGQMNLRVGHHSYQLKEGCLSIISPDIIFFGNKEDDDLEIIQIKFTKNFLVDTSIKEKVIDELLYLNNDYPPVYTLETTFEQVMSLFQILEVELLKKGPYYLDIIRLNIISILYEYNRACEYCLLGFEKNMNRQYQLTVQFKKLVEEQYKTLKTVQQYADLMGLTAKHLSEVVRKQTGQTALQLIHERIVLEAQYLLKYSTLSIKECAFDLGFTDMSYFVRFFKTNVKVTPAHFRKEIV